MQSLEHAATPLIVSQVVVAFELYYTINNPPPFTPGGPVTVTIGRFSPPCMWDGLHIVWDGKGTHTIKYLVFQCEAFAPHCWTAHDTRTFHAMVGTIGSPALGNATCIYPIHSATCISGAGVLSQVIRKLHNPKIQMHLGVASHTCWMMECLNHSAFFTIMLASLIPPPLHCSYHGIIHSWLLVIIDNRLAFNIT